MCTALPRLALNPTPTAFTPSRRLEGTRPTAVGVGLPTSKSGEILQYFPLSGPAGGTVIAVAGSGIPIETDRQVLRTGRSWHNGTKDRSQRYGEIRERARRVTNDSTATGGERGGA